MSERLRVVNPQQFVAPKGYANGVVTEGPLLHVGGQIGWNANQEFESDDFIRQFSQALDHVITIVETAGGSPGDIASMTVYVTDIALYRSAGKELGVAWRDRLGRHYPAMALMAVTALVEPRALVEIQAVAVLKNGGKQ